MKQEKIKALSRLLYVYVVVMLYLDLAFYLAFYGVTLPLGSTAPNFWALFVSVGTRIALNGLGLVGLIYLRRQRDRERSKASATSKALSATQAF